MGEEGEFVCGGRGGVRRRAKGGGGRKMRVGEGEEEMEGNGVEEGEGRQDGKRECVWLFHALTTVPVFLQAPSFNQVVAHLQPLQRVQSYRSQKMVT